MVTIIFTGPAGERMSAKLQTVEFTVNGQSMILTGEGLYRAVYYPVNVNDFQERQQ